MSQSNLLARAELGFGDPLPLGLTRTCDGFNLAVFSRHASAVSVLLFDPATDALIETVALDPERNRTGDIWHVALTDQAAGKAYALKVDGPWAPEQGHRFDGRTCLLDPCAPAVVGTADGRDQRVLGSGSLRGLITEDRFDWQNDVPPRHAWKDTVIYETHVRGLTIHSSSGARHPGQYLGVAEKIPYLRGLGITAVELMPVQEFADWEVSQTTDKPVRNYWGYNPVGLFAPKSGYGSGTPPGAGLTEFKTMVRELHMAGIEVILDVVFNHTAEGNEDGPTFSFRGLENSVYYMLGVDKRRYVDFTGCGNTLNCNHPVVRSLIIDCLRHWVVHYHVDGFRFDLASVLGRNSDGRLLANPPLLDQIAEDPLLRHIKLIAEAWDAGGAFQVGHFPGQRWAEWNCHFRDDVRRFWRGDAGMAGAFATRLAGSADLYQRNQETPLNSINFVTSHDGFTLNDLVSYTRKHNESNGEDNRDGTAENYSDDNGVEGPSGDPDIEAVRLRQIKNLLVSLFTSRGVPMLLGGDEFRRTQSGNNNAYCQDSETSWYDWRLVEGNAGLIRFVSGLIAFRKAHPVLSAERFYSEREITWLSADGQPPDWQGPNNRIGCLISDAEEPHGQLPLALLFNAGLEPCRFGLPTRLDGHWRIAVDTSRSSPDDLPERESRPVMSQGLIELESRSTIILVADPYTANA